MRPWPIIITIVTVTTIGDITAIIIGIIIITRFITVIPITIIMVIMGPIPASLAEATAEAGIVAAAFTAAEVTAGAAFTAEEVMAEEAVMAGATAAGMATISPAIRSIKPPGIPGGLSHTGRPGEGSWYAQTAVDWAARECWATLNLFPSQPRPPHRLRWSGRLGKVRFGYLVPATGEVEIDGLRVGASDVAAIGFVVWLKVTAMTECQIVLVDAA